MYLKTAIVLSCFAASYVLLVFAARNAWQALPLAIVLGISTAGIGFNIQHDGGHNAYSKRAWINRTMAMTLDLIGGSSYIWRWKHAVFHHRYVNISGYDPDIEIGMFGRLSPHQKWRPFHRWQHLYLWPLYGLIAVKWHLVDDFRSVATGWVGPHRIPRPRGTDMVIFVAGKAAFLSLAFVIPLLFHPFWIVLFYYALAAVVLGMLMSLIFQLPHCVEKAEFPLPEKETGRIKNPWAVHQARVTLDFSRGNPILTWPLGGLNYHLEHHLFPIICHVNYPAITKIVQDTCGEFGIVYKEHRSFREGMASHFRWLRQMGMPDGPIHRDAG